MKAPATLYLLILYQDVWYLLLDIWKLLQQSDRNWCFLWCCVCVCRGARGYSLSFAGIWDAGVSPGVSCPIEKESMWLTGRKAWMTLPCQISAVPRVRSIIRLSADSPHSLCSVSWRHVVRKWTCVLVFEPHVTEQSCMPILNPLLWEGRTFSGVETALSLMTNIC